MSPSHAAKGGRRWRYYVSQAGRGASLTVTEGDDVIGYKSPRVRRAILRASAATRKVGLSARRKACPTQDPRSMATIKDGLGTRAK